METLKSPDDPFANLTSFTIIITSNNTVQILCAVNIWTGKVYYFALHGIIVSLNISLNKIAYKITRQYSENLKVI